MCRRQPGPRCPKHSKQRLHAKVARLERLQDQLSKHTPGSSKYDRTLAEIRELKDQIIMDDNDYNSSPSRWKELADFLEKSAADGNTDSPEFKKAARDLATGKMLWAERRRQNKMMPPIDRKTASHAARAAWDDLGNARAEMARYKVRMDMNGADYKTWLKWQKGHYAAAQEAEIAAAKFQAITKDGPSAWRELSPEKRLALRQQVGATADFTTATSPKALSDVVNDYADQAEGKQPFLDPELANHLTAADNPDPEIDSPSWAEKRARDQAKKATEQAPSSDVPNPPTVKVSAPQAPAPPGGKSAAAKKSPTTADAPAQSAPAQPRQKTPPGYAGQRARRKRRLASGRQVWTAAKRGEQQFGNGKLAQYTRPDPEQSKNPEASAMTDPTGLSLLLEMLKPSRG